jgi:hypothetical protein
VNSSPHDDASGGAVDSASCVSLFLAAADRFPDRAALREVTSSISFRDLKRDGLVCAAAYRDY